VLPLLLFQAMPGRIHADEKSGKAGSPFQKISGLAQGLSGRPNAHSLQRE
jgi:hypothetical protein